MTRITEQLRTASTFIRKTTGAALVEYVVIVALIGVVGIGTVLQTGETIRCVFYDAASRVGASIDPGSCGSTGVASGGTPTSGSPTEPPTPAPTYTVTFDDTQIDSSEINATSITVGGVTSGDDIDLLLTQDAQSLVLTAVAAGGTHQFANVNMSSFSRGEVTAVATVTPSGGTSRDSDPDTTTLNIPLMIEPDTPINGIGFGEEIVMNASRIFVGAPQHDGTGRIYAFDRNTGEELFYIDGDSGRGASLFGQIMALGGGYLAVTSQEPSGYDFVSVYDMNGTYLFDVDEDPAADNDNYFGREIQIEGATLVVGDQLHVFGVGNQGGVHAFDLASGGAHLWSAQDSTFLGSGSRFDIDGGLLYATPWSQDGLTVWNMSDGSVDRVKSANQSRRAHIEVVNGHYVYGETPFNLDIYGLTSYYATGAMSLTSGQDNNNVFEQAGDLVMVNTSLDVDVTLVDLSTNSVTGTIAFPDTLPPLLPNFGAGMAYEGGEAAIGAPGHQPRYDGVRSGAVYLLPLP